MPAGVSLSGWYVGYVIAAVVIAIVVVLVAIILAVTRKIGTQALAITEGLVDGRNNTMALWEVERVNDRLRGLLRDAQEARRVLGGGGR